MGFIRRRGGVSKKKKSPRYAPFRSALEKRVAGLLTGYAYEPRESVVNYTMPHKYNPDFVPNSNKRVLLEVKGYFRTSSEAAKYVAITKDNPSIELIFIFSNPIKKAHPGCRVRKNGTIMTLAEWCERQEFLYYHEKKLPREITTGNITDKWITQERVKRGYHVDTT